jgi:RsiW-degrading membrane proteinase PrsW (M82 family)
MLMFAVMLVLVAVAAGLAWFLVSEDHGEKEPVLALWLAAGLGLAGGIAAAVIEGRLMSPGDLSPTLPHVALLKSAMTVGVIEELCKFLPLAIVIYKKRYFNEYTDGVLYFALAGLGFGLPENLIYTVQYGAGAGFLRVLITPFFHAAITGMVGYFLIRLKMKGRSVFGILLPLAAAIILHGLYDFGLVTGTTALGTFSLTVALGLSAALFMLFLRASEFDQSLGKSVVGHNAFCRSCGLANPRHHLYCIRCGKNA